MDSEAIMQLAEDLMTHIFKQARSLLLLSNPAHPPPPLSAILSESDSDLCIPFLFLLQHCMPVMLSPSCVLPSDLKQRRHPNEETIFL